MRSLLTVAFILTLTLVAQAQQKPRFEKRMYNIYKQSYSEEINDERWASYLTNIGNRTYSIREGDTLWDLSVVFFGDGLFWSKIWSYNAGLTNPHFLKVGQDIAFFSGSIEEAPGMTVEPDASTVVDPELEPDAPKGLPKGFTEVAPEAPNEEDGATAGASPALPANSQQASATTNKSDDSPRPSVTRGGKGLYPGAPSIPPPRNLIKPVLEKIPYTFSTSDTYDASKYDAKGISFDLRPPVRVNPLFVAHSFLYGRSAIHYPKYGTLVESEDNARLVGLNQVVYIRSPNKIEVGDRFTVMGREYDFDRNGIKGEVIEYQGSVEITENMKEDNLYRGKIIKSLSGIKGNPWISREPIPTFNDDYVGRPNDKKIQIIGGGPDNVSRFYGQGEVVFLAGGQNKGVRVGDIFAIYKRRDIRYPGTKIERSPVPIGHIKVFRSEPELASAFVISSDDVIVPGDETGAPTIVEAKVTKSEQEDLNSIETGLDFPVDPVPSNDSSLEQELSEFE